MATKLSIWIIVTCILRMVLQIFHINAQGGYQVSLIWPWSLCLSPGGVSCEEPIKRKFLIGAVLPMGVNGIVLQPYDHESPCTDTPPMDQDSLTEEWLRKENLLEDMMTSWSYIENYSNLTANIIHWQSLWRQYGMCFRNSDKGYLDYFGTGLRVASSINLTEILKKGGYIPCPPSAYAENRIIPFLDESMGKIVQIICYEKESPKPPKPTDYVGMAYFGGIALCYGNHDVLVDCPNKFFGCPNDLRLLAWP